MVSVEELKTQTASQYLNAIMQRRMTERKEETYELFMDKDKDCGGGTACGAAATPTRPPRHAAAASASAAFASAASAASPTMPRR